MSSNINRFWALGLGLLLAVVAPSFGGSIVVNGDFNNPSDPPTATYNGLAAAPDLATDKFWNSMTVPATNSVTFSSLLDSDGITSTPITFTLTQSGAGNLSIFPNGVDSSTPPANFLALMGDYVYTFSGTVSFEWDNVPSGAVYTLYLYSENGVGYNTITPFVVNGNTLTATNSSTSNTFILNDNYVSIGNLTPIAGVISGSMTYTAGTHGPGAAPAFDGFQLVETTPEPASLGTLLIGGSMLLKRRRRA